GRHRPRRPRQHPRARRRGLSRLAASRRRARRIKPRHRPGFLCYEMNGNLKQPPSSRAPAVLLLTDKHLTPEEEELARKKAILAELETQLADRELERASILAELVHFENRYLQSVGRRYAILDDLKA